MPRKSKEGVIIWRTIIAGGSTVASCGNGTRCLQKELSDIGIDLEEELTETEKETNVKLISEEFLSEGSKNIMQAAKGLGYKMQPMPKFIDTEKCINCGQCAFGCSRDAKWTALNYLDKAIEQGLEIEYNVSIEQVLFDNGKAIGVRGVSQNGRQDYFADVVILAAGGLGTPIILQNSGVQNAGTGLFVDLLINTYGVTDNISQKNEPVMALIDREFYKQKGFILSTYINSNPLVRFIELGAKGLALPSNRLIGIMNKTADESKGQVYTDGTISKPITEKDWQRLKEGSAIAKEILLNAGAKPNSIIFSKVQGAHPGGTAAIGKIVDKNLQTEIKNLYVCDASVLPKSPGMPPILTICALAKKLAKKLSIN
jgi:choline dehydrogenase-like flavoprotein